MRLIISLTVLLAVALTSASGEQQRILRRVIKSTPTATNLGRVKLVTVRSSESGGVTEISSKEAAKFGERSANETSSNAGLKTKLASPSAPASTTTTTTTTTTTSTPTPSSAAPSTAAPSTSTSKPELPQKPKASDRQQAASTSGEVELLSSAPSSWQTMTAVEAPAAMLIATGTRAASSSSSASDLSSSSSTLYSSEESASQTGDFLRSGSTKGGRTQQLNGDSFSRLRQQSTKQQQQQQSFFYPENRVSKTNNQASKTPWYQPTTTTARPAPLVQEFEQQSEQYVEQQQQQVEYGAAPLGQAEPFAFDFKTQDQSGNGQYRKEESDKNGVVRGSYGYTDANGIYRHVEYVADQNGFRANIKSNEPGLIGETQPASIQLAGGAAPAAGNQRLRANSNNNNDNGDWVSTNSNSGSSQGSSADLALAPPEFESSHKPESARLPRHYRN